MKHTLIFSMTTAAGAGQYAAALIFEDGQARNLAQWTAPRAMAITSIKAMGALGTQFTITRSGHPADNNVFACLADTLADAEKTIDLQTILDGAGIEVLQNENVAMLVTVTGNATVNVIVELDDLAPRVNTRSFNFAGAAAAVANTPVETGANLRAGLSNTARYKLKALHITSTTIQGLISIWNVKGQECVEPIECCNALLSGTDNYKRLEVPPTGTGAQYLTDYQLWILAVAADAAAVQLGYAILETN